MDVVFYSLVPMFIIIICNTIIIYNIVKSKRASSSQNRVSSVTYILIGTCVGYLVCATPYIVYASLALHGYSRTQWFGPEERIYKHVGTLMFTLNSAINFWLYVASGPAFRRELLKMLHFWRI